ncbi:MAG TPA: DUF2934 domain-containing protein [Polyangia bacterium]
MKTIGRKTVKGEKTSAPKAVKAGAGTTSKMMAASASRSVPTHEEVARRAYELYLARGAEHGHDAEDWAQAESELGL